MAGQAPGAGPPAHAGEARWWSTKQVARQKDEGMLLLLTSEGEVAGHRGTVRGAFFNDGRNHDVLLYGLLRTDPPWHPEAAAPG